jgi:hypothetical protein
VSRAALSYESNCVNADLAKAYPPDGETTAWWDRLKRALGTTSSAFVNASLLQVQAAARLPFSGISETALNAALAMIEAAAPKDEIEGALAVQMACTHTATMAVLARLGGGHGSEQRVAARLGCSEPMRSRSKCSDGFVTAANNTFVSSTFILMTVGRRLLAT